MYDDATDTHAQASSLQCGHVQVLLMPCRPRSMTYQPGCDALQQIRPTLVFTEILCCCIVLLWRSVCAVYKQPLRRAAIVKFRLGSDPRDPNSLPKGLTQGTPTVCSKGLLKGPQQAAQRADPKDPNSLPKGLTQDPVYRRCGCSVRSLAWGSQRGGAAHAGAHWQCGEHSQVYRGRQEPQGEDVWLWSQVRFFFVFLVCVLSNTTLSAIAATLGTDLSIRPLFAAVCTLQSFVADSLVIVMLQ